MLCHLIIFLMTIFLTFRMSHLKKIHHKIMLIKKESTCGMVYYVVYTGVLKVGGILFNFKTLIC